MEKKPTYEELEGRTMTLEARLAALVRAEDDRSEGAAAPATAGDDSHATLTRGMVHDFNNVLAAILGYTEMAMSELPEGCRPHGHLKEVLHGVGRARSLARQILSFSRREPQEPHPVKIGPFLEHAVRILRPSIPSAVMIRTEIGEDGGHVLADPNQLLQVMADLCANAGHAMKERGGILYLRSNSIAVDGASETLPPGLSGHSFTRITVSDSGRGMPPEVKDRIFEPRLTGKPAGEGRGAGLAVALDIVERHGGGITVESEPGRGSTISVFLPETRGDDSLEENDGSVIPPGAGEILLVDDEPSLARLGKQLLGKAGYGVTALTDGRSALELVRTDPDRFDAVITDQSMPDLTGTALAKELLALRPSLPVIICSGDSDGRHEEEALRIGVKAFVVKPFTRRTLAGTVRKVLGG